MSAECEFCRIVDGDLPAHVVHVDDRTVAFLDRHPAVTGHTLIAPTVHLTEVITANEWTTPLFRTVRTVAVAMERTLDPDGFSVFHSSGQLVGTVEHAHVHLLPRRIDDEVRVALTRHHLDDREGKRLAEQLASQL